MKKMTKERLDSIKQESKSISGDWIKVGMSACGIAAGAQEVFNTLGNEIRKHGLGIKLCMCGCAGMCYAEPLVEVKVKDMPQVTYGRVDEKTAADIVEKHVMAKQLLNDHIYNVRTEING